MKNSFRWEWGIVDMLDINTVTNLILTGCKPNEAYPDDWFFKFFGDANQPQTILDFGCGLGRNTLKLAKEYPNWTIVGYDSESMLEKVQEFANINYDGEIPPNVQFISDWEQLKCRKFDKIAAIIVLQHIFESDLVEYIKDFKQMTHFLFVAGRRYNDDKGKRSTWTILEEQGLIPYKFYCEDKKVLYVAEGDPNEHNIAYYQL
jgi:SAM-dependent methyltransferase